jgi:hypothetical protein
VPVKKLILSEISWSSELATDSMRELKVVVALPSVCSAWMKVLTSAVACLSVKQSQGLKPKGSGLGVGVATTAEAAASVKRIDLSCILEEKIRLIGRAIEERM